jgi:methyl-accepting chemotaxis protein
VTKSTVPTIESVSDELRQTRKELAQTRRQVVRLTETSNQLSRVLKVFSGLTTETLLEPPATNFDDPEMSWLYGGGVD